MSVKCIALKDCEYNGKFYKAGEWATFGDDDEIATLYWMAEADYLEAEEADLAKRNCYYTNR